MFAIVDIAGQQFKVEKDQKLYVHRLDGEAGSDIFLDKVLLIDNDKNVIVGNPVISDAVISVKILSHVKSDKVQIFKKRRRKAYQILKGHRQLMTEIQVSEILEKGGSKAIKEAPAKKTVKETTPGVTDQKETVKKSEKKVTTEKKEALKSEKTTGKASGKDKIVSDKKGSESKTRTGKPSDSKKSSAPSLVKSTKTKSGTVRKASSKKTDKPPKK
jgi:large subunit ribosomal protein L21